jgi:hypothetical protein
MCCVSCFIISTWTKLNPLGRVRQSRSKIFYPFIETPLPCSQKTRHWFLLSVDECCPHAFYNHFQPFKDEVQIALFNDPFRTAQ